MSEPTKEEVDKAVQCCVEKDSDCQNCPLADKVRFCQKVIANAYRESCKEIQLLQKELASPILCTIGRMAEAIAEVEQLKKIEELARPLSKLLPGAVELRQALCDLDKVRQL